MAYLLGIDIGTSGTKTALSMKRVKACVIHGRISHVPTANGWAEQIRLTGGSHCCRYSRRHRKHRRLSNSWNRAVRTNARPCYADAAGNVLRRSIIWCDQRTAAQCDEITERVGADRLMEITKSPALTGFTASKILWVRENEPEIYEKCKTILLPKDYIRFMLTGEIATEVSDASGMQLLDIAKRQWSDEVLEKLDIDRSLLGRVYESPDITGRVTRSAAELTGLMAGTPVVGGGGDNAASAVGCGGVCGGKAFTTIGTSGVVFAHSPTVTGDPAGRIHSFCAAVPGEWHVMGVVQSAGLSLRWFRDNFCAAEEAEAQKRGIGSYRVMDEYAAKVPVGSNRLIYLPYLMGERTPHLDPFARGVFFGLSAVHTRHDMLRAVMEGVTFALRDSLTIFNEANVTVDSMMACGGGASSPLWRQMLADVFNCTVLTAESNEVGALGAALLAAAGTGIYGSVGEACDAVIRIKEHCDPIPENVKNTKSFTAFTQIFIQNKGRLRSACRYFSLKKKQRRYVFTYLRCFFLEKFLHNFYAVIL